MKYTNAIVAIILVLLICGFAYMYIKLNSTANEKQMIVAVEKLSKSIKCDMNKYLTKIQNLCNNNFEQLRKITALHFQPITKITNHFTETLESDKQSDINYLSDIMINNTKYSQYYMSDNASRNTTSFSTTSSSPSKNLDAKQHNNNFQNVHTHVDKKTSVIPIITVKNDHNSSEEVDINLNNVVDNNGYSIQNLQYLINTNEPLPFISMNTIVSNIDKSPISYNLSDNCIENCITINNLANCLTDTDINKYVAKNIADKMANSEPYITLNNNYSFFDIKNKVTELTESEKSISTTNKDDDITSSDSNSVKCNIAGHNMTSTDPNGILENTDTTLLNASVCEANIFLTNLSSKENALSELSDNIFAELKFLNTNNNICVENSHDNIINSGHKQESNEHLISELENAKNVTDNNTQRTHEHDLTIIDDSNKIISDGCVITSTENNANTLLQKDKDINICNYGSTNFDRHKNIDEYSINELRNIAKKRNIKITNMTNENGIRKIKTLKKDELYDLIKQNTSETN